MKIKKLLSFILIACLIVGCCGGAFARVMHCPEILLDQPVVFRSETDAQAAYYRFMAPADGTYVFYDVSEETACDITVHSVAPDALDFEEQTLTSGVGSVGFTLAAGESCWIVAHCPEVDADYSFALVSAVPVEELRLENVTLASGFLGESGAADLICLPFGSGDAVTWTSEDETVATVSGDQNGASYDLVGPGTTTITATTAGGLTVSFQVTAVDPNTILIPGETRKITIAANGGLYDEYSSSFTFTAETDGAYALAVSFDKSMDLWCGVQMSANVDGHYLHSSDVLRFEAKAGQSYTIDVEFWGNYSKDVDYLFLLEVSGKAQAITLIPETSAGYVGDSLYINVVWDPETSLVEPLTWISSDPSIADITYTGEEYAVLELYAAGSVTITASTASGLIHSVPIVVVDVPQVLELTAGVAQPLLLLGYGNQPISFTPAETGYYRLSVSSEDLDAYFFESGIYIGSDYLYYLIGGASYGGGVDCYSDEMTPGEVLVEKVEVLTLAGMDITAVPENTVYLKEDLEDLWIYDVLSGLRMDLTWSDGSVTSWSFDEEGPYVGDEELQWQIVVNEDGSAELLLTCAQLSTSCPMTVLDKMIASIRLVDDSPVRLVERSCGMEMADGSWLYDSYSYAGRQVELTFTDGSVVLAWPEEQVYGGYVICQDDQAEAPWVKGGDNRVSYSYGNMTVELMVHIIESPVERLELLTPPRDVFIIGELDFFTDAGEHGYFFTPVDIRQMLTGLRMTVWYKDGTSRMISDEDIQWLEVAGEYYPFADGYPIGIFSDLLLGMEPINGPCQREGYLEYMGISLTYPVRMVEEGQPVDPTDPTEPSTEPTEPSTEPTEPSTEPTEPSTEPTEPSTEPTEPSTEPTEPSTEPTEPSTEPTEPSTEPAEPSTEPTEPSTEPTEPSTEPTEPSTEPTEPSTEPTEPSTAPTEPPTQQTTEAPVQTTEEAVPPTRDAEPVLLPILMIGLLMSLALILSGKKEI